MDSSNCDEFNSLLERYLLLKEQYAKSELTLNLKTKELREKQSLTDQYRNILEDLDKEEQLENAEFEEKLANLDIRVSSFESDFQSELLKKSNQIESLKKELETLKIGTKVPKLETAPVSNDLEDLLIKENELLKLDNEELFQEKEKHETQCKNVEAEIREYLEEESELNEMFAIKKEELMEITKQIENLNNNILIAEKRLAQFEAGSFQGTDNRFSLFAEVNNEQVCLRKTVDDLKGSYLELKQVYMKIDKHISRLQKRLINNELLRKKDLQECQNDIVDHIEALKAEIALIQDINMCFNNIKQKQEIGENSSSDTICQEYIEDIDNHIKQLKQTMQNWLITKNLFSSSLAKTNWEIKLRNLTISQLEGRVNHKEILSNTSDEFNSSVSSNGPQNSGITSPNSTENGANLLDIKETTLNEFIDQQVTAHIAVLDDLENSIICEKNVQF